ncbi:MAG: glycine cleavage system aminomethyltransferase GcvT [Magnetococcales bacterium]|nr:glycine cleavage system aminomethyltransferase GcvT [Magnetococcales bacterium]
MQQTPLHSQHVARGAKMVDFSGWDMPLHYGSQLQEHNIVRSGCGLFDVSHMGVVDVRGAESTTLLQRLLACDVARLPAVEPGQVGRGMYGVMLTERGYIADDLIVYRLGENVYSVVVNAGTRKKDIAWMRTHASALGVEINERSELAIIAVQGPKASTSLSHVLPEGLESDVKNLKPFHIIDRDGWRIARTGYTGEDGFEFMIPDDWAERVWRGLVLAGGVPVGLGARDTLRLEAGFNLYGNDMDEKHNPMESGVGWTIHWQPESRGFIGRQAIEQLRNRDDNKKRVGLVMQGKGVLRDRQKVVVAGVEVGEITSGGFSPTLKKGIALARVVANLAVGVECHVDVRGRLLPVSVVRPPFVKNGQPVRN